MPHKNFYDILGIPHSATAEQIREAYLLRAKVLHPDRFDPYIQKDEWKLANALLADLNEAYSCLRDAECRERYDFYINQKMHDSYKEKKNDYKDDTNNDHNGYKNTSNAYENFDFNKLYFGSFSLKSTTDENNSEVNKFIELTSAAKLDLSPIKKYYVSLAILFPLFIFYILGIKTISVQNFKNIFEIIILLIFALAIAYSASSLVRWHRSKTKDFIIITNLYIVHCNFDYVYFWPIHFISKIDTKHCIKNGIYNKTIFNFYFNGVKRRFTAYSRLNSDRFIQNLYNVKNEFVKNYKSNNWNYFNSNFIFTSHDDVKASRKKSKFNFNIILTLIFISISFFAIGIYYTKNLNSNLQTNQNNNEIIQNNNDRKTQKIKISSPEYYGNPQIPPKNGYTKNLTRSKDRAPLVIKTQNNETFFLVKLADLNGHDVKIIFIHGGMDIETKMPLGKYILKYATGSTWYGWDNYFGAETQYYKADEVFDFHTENNIISGYTVELYLQINGNLYTSKINEQEF